MLWLVPIQWPHWNSWQMGNRATQMEQDLIEKTELLDGNYVGLVRGENTELWLCFCFYLALFLLLLLLDQWQFLVYCVNTKHPRFFASSLSSTSTILYYAYINFVTQHIFDVTRRPNKNAGGRARPPHPPLCKNSNVLQFVCFESVCTCSRSYSSWYVNGLLAILDSSLFRSIFRLSSCSLVSFCVYSSITLYFDVCVFTLFVTSGWDV